MDSSDNGRPAAAAGAAAADPFRPRIVRSQSAAASIGRLAVERTKPPLPPRRGIDYDVNGNIEPYRSASRAEPVGAAVNPVVKSAQVTWAAMPSNAVATQNYFSLIRPTCFPSRMTGTTQSNFAIMSSKENRQTADGAVPAVTPLKHTMRPSRLAPLPPPKTPPTPQPRTLLSPKRLRCYSEPTSDAENISRPASDSDACASLGTAAAVAQRKLPDAQRSSPVNVGVGSSSQAVGAAFDMPPDAFATAHVVLASPTAPGTTYVFCKLQGVTLRVVKFVEPPASTAAEPKPDSLTYCELPSVVWHADELPQSHSDHGGLLVAAPSKGNRSAEPAIPPTLEEEEEEEKAEEKDGDYSSLNDCPVPLYPAPSRPGLANESFCTSNKVAACAPYESSDYVDPVSITSARAGHYLKTEVNEGATQQKEEVERRRKKDYKIQRRDEKRQKEEERQRKVQEKAERKEKERREKDYQKRAAELQKLLSLYKVSITAPPLCEAIVNKDNLKPEKNELSVHAGERVFILAKDSKGKCLARSSISRGNVIGTVASSNLLLAETERRGHYENYSADDPDGIYEELGK